MMKPTTKQLREFAKQAYNDGHPTEADLQTACAQLMEIWHVEKMYGQLQSFARLKLQRGEFANEEVYIQNDELLAKIEGDA